jgi:hypothetical protein
MLSVKLMLESYPKNVYYLGQSELLEVSLAYMMFQIPPHVFG